MRREEKGSPEEKVALKNSAGTRGKKERHQPFKANTSSGGRLPKRTERKQNCSTISPKTTAGFPRKNASRFGEVAAYRKKEKGKQKNSGANKKER